MIKFNIDIKKPEELGLETHHIREYLDDEGNLVKHDDITEDIVHMYVDIDDNPDNRVNVVVGFGKYGLSENHGLEDMTVREFITETLKPNIFALNKSLNKKLSESNIEIHQPPVSKTFDLTEGN